MKKLIRKIKGFPNYTISNYGEVFNVNTSKELKGHTSLRGRKYIYLQKNGKNVTFMLAKLILTHFQKTEINKDYALHLDLDLSNCRNDNLKYGTKGDVLRMFNTIRNKKRGVYSFKIKSANGISYNRFRAVLKIDGKAKTLGYFKSKQEAELCYLMNYKDIYGYEPYVL